MRYVPGWRSQEAITHPDNRVPSNYGPGTELKRQLARLGFGPANGCECAKHIGQMNRKGIEWCEKNVPLIVRWLHKEAKRQKLYFTVVGATILVRWALNRYRRRVKERAK